MAIKQLTEEQIHTMTVEEKDRWWLENVYQGNAKQMTVRVVFMGFILGGLLSITNLYVGAKAGWSLGVAITAVILSFVFFKALERIGLVGRYHVLESNILQSIACSAGYMNGPLIASMAAYMIVTNTIVPWWQMIMWLLGMAVLGVLFAFPLKRRFINEEQLPFPEGRAAGVVMDTLHSEEGGKSVLPATMLVIATFVAGVLQFFQWDRMHGWLEKARLGFLAVPEFLDTWYYELAVKKGWPIPDILGTKLTHLSIQPQVDIAMFGAGGLMGIRTGVSLMIGAVVNYCVLAPIMINRGDILGAVGPDGALYFNFRMIATWALWCGVAMMTTASLYSFLGKPEMLLKAFGGGKRKADASADDGAANGKLVAVCPAKHCGIVNQADAEVCVRCGEKLTGTQSVRSVMKSIELPLWVSVLFIPIVGAYMVYIAHWFFGVSYLMGAIAIPLVFVFTLIAVNSTALTSITPTGALGKMTQLVYAGLAPGNIQTNIATAGIAAEVGGGASNLIQNIKPGYMLGAKPRYQAVGHIVGAVSGVLFSVLVFYPLFLQDGPGGLQSAEYPYPAATIWVAVAELLTRGLKELPTSAAYAVLIGAALGVLLEAVRMRSKGKMWISPVGIGLAFVIPFTTCFAMFMGSFVFWLIGLLWRRPEQRMNAMFVQNQESICAGIVAGAALIGVLTMALDLLLK